MRSELSLKQPGGELPDAAHKQQYQAIAVSLIYLSQVTWYNIQYAVNEMARAMSQPSKVHMAAAEHILRYLAGAIDFEITYKAGAFKLAAFSDAN